ncbi:MAG: Oxidoreductase family, C-terminal alpha/beta domain, partial [Labilithrix sp.]|nr:Oxidoreductase family, C-terminal alpha/beta domain [Labilithrix sp.]
GVETNARLRGVLRIAEQRVPARMEFSWSHRLRRSIQVIGSKATVEAHIQDPKSLTLHRQSRSGAMEMLIRCADTWHPSSAYRAQISDFVDAVRERRAPFVAAESAVKALAVIETAYAKRTTMAQPWLERMQGCA